MTPGRRLAQGDPGAIAPSPIVSRPVQHVGDLVLADLMIENMRRTGCRVVINRVRQKNSWVDSGSGNLPSE